MSADGEVAARDARLPNLTGSLLLASAEVKAIQTVALMAGRDAADVTTDPDFGEVRRNEPVDTGFRERRRAWIRGDVDGRHSGWETPADAAARFDAALDRYRGVLIVGTHGMILTAWLAHVGHVDAGEPAARFWESLRFPDVITVER